MVAEGRGHVRAQELSWDYIRMLVNAHIPPYNLKLSDRQTYMKHASRPHQMPTVAHTPCHFIIWIVTCSTLTAAHCSASLWTQYYRLPFGGHSSLVPPLWMHTACRYKTVLNKSVTGWEGDTDTCEKELCEWGSTPTAHRANQILVQCWQETANPSSIFVIYW